MIREKKEGGLELVGENASQPGLSVIPQADYECARCGRRVSPAGPASLQSPRCENCGFGVFRKARPGIVKQIAAA